jgi:lipopolysaccharide transport system ATP-binding protein
MPTVISVENLSKAYSLGQIGTGTFKNDLKLWWAKARGKPNPLLRIGEADHGNRDGETIWALKDVSFKVEQGEVLGIIGRNGAGKSTLLKILSRVTAPTSGKIKVKGRVASLLEVGTGFHPELTGRENIYLNGAILGMNRREIDRKFDEIVDFAEVEKFIDTPVKRYSSGMYVRLAFAVAAHLEPEILVVDEVLAVGDAEFQKKCLGKMGKVAQEGRTVLFVSHNMGAVASLCTRTLWIVHGLVEMDNISEKVVNKYLSLTTLAESADGEVLVPNTNHLPLSNLWMRTRDRKNKIRTSFSNNEPIIVEFEFTAIKQIPQIKIGFEISTSMGEIMFQSFHNDIKEQLFFQNYLSPSTYKLYATIPSGLLNTGKYYLSPCIGIHRKTWLIKNYPKLSLNVEFILPNNDFFVSKRPGFIAPILSWAIERNI